MNLRYLVYELKEEIRGLWLVVLAGAIGPSVVCVSAYLLEGLLDLLRGRAHLLALYLCFFLFLSAPPLPIALAAFIKRKEKGIGSAVLLGSSLGYMIMASSYVLTVFRYDPVKFEGCWVCRPTAGIFVTIMFPTLILYIAPQISWLLILWGLSAAYPAYVIHGKQVSSRLTLLITSASLAIGSVLSLICSMSVPPRSDSGLKIPLMLSSILDAFLSIFFIYYALGGMKGKKDLISFVTFSLLVRIFCIL